jgi:hypothetical protein
MPDCRFATSMMRRKRNPIRATIMRLVGRTAFSFPQSESRNTKRKKKNEIISQTWEDLIFSLLILAALHGAGALRYEIESGRTKCITEEMKMNSMSIGKYSVVGLTSEDQSITVRVCVLISSYIFHF